MSSNSTEQVKVDFNKDWFCRESNDFVEINTNTSNRWKPIELPHTIRNDDDESENTTGSTAISWWYRKEFQWKHRHTNFNEKIYLFLETIKNANDDYLLMNYLTVWLNKVQIYSDTYEPSKIIIDLTGYLFYEDEDKENNETNLLLICCKNSSLHLRSSLLVSPDQEHAVHIVPMKLTSSQSFISSVLPKNGVINHLVDFNAEEGRYDILFNLNLKSPIISQLAMNPKITVDNDQDQSETETERTDNSESTETIPIPRLAIVMLIVGTRGDVQPFIA